MEKKDRSKRDITIKRLKKKVQGMTLLSLIVTIIVLLILAGISLNLTMGQNGIFTRAENAVETYESAQLKEKIEMIAAGSIIGKFSENNVEKTAKEIENELNNWGENVLVVKWDKYIIFDLNQNNEYRVTSDGSVEYNGKNNMGSILKNTTEANAEQKESRNSGYIGIGTDGNTVNLDLWEYAKNNENCYTLNNNIEDLKETSIMDMSGGCGYVAGENEENIVDGKIKGCVPMYIKSSQDESWIAVTSMFGTFYNIKNLVTPPEIPDTVISLRETFLFCDNLTSMPVIPNDVENMGSTFNSCSKLVTVTSIPNKVTSMAATFMNCGSLESFGDIPDSVTTMQITFHGCGNLKQVGNIGKGVKNMYLTFAYCTNLKIVPEIPSNVIDMRQTFAGCNNLTGIITINANLTGAIISDGQIDYQDIFNYAANNEGCEIKLTGTCPMLENIVNSSNTGNVTLLN